MTKVKSEVRFVRIKEKLMAGQMLRMSMANNRTRELWSAFMPQRLKIDNKVDNDLISLSVFDSGFGPEPGIEFQKWALVEVSEKSHLPEGMTHFTLPEGDYAVFVHYGKQAEYMRTFAYIFTEWFPGSKYELDDRPHFEIMNEKYKPLEDDSEEEIWIPIRKKSV